MNTELNRNPQFKLDKSAFSRSLPEILSEAVKLARGMFVRLKLDKCGPLLRCGKGIQINRKNAVIHVGRKVQLYSGVKISAVGAGGICEISIGDGTSIGNRTEIHAGEKVEIGSGCNISWDVCIMDRDYHKLNSPSEVIKPVKICDNVWIGCNTIILKGVTIGEGAVVAAGSVVTHDVAPCTLVGGNPARVLKEEVYWLP